MNNYEITEDPARNPVALLLEAGSAERFARRICDVAALVKAERLQILADDSTDVRIEAPGETVLVAFTLNRAVEHFGQLMQRYPTMGVVGIFDDSVNAARLLLDFDNSWRALDRALGRVLIAISHATGEVEELDVGITQGGTAALATLGTRSTPERTSPDVAGEQAEAEARGIDVKRSGTGDTQRLQVSVDTLRVNGPAERPIHVVFVRTVDGTPREETVELKPLRHRPGWVAANFLAAGVDLTVAWRIVRAA